MARIKITDFQDIDFVTIDYQQDEFELPNGKVYRFSEHVCHRCWSGGTVLKSITDGELICVQCRETLTWRKFINDFLEPTGDEWSFLLPKNWTEEQLKKWYDNYKERRLAEEELRQRILKEGGE